MRINKFAADATIRTVMDDMSDYPSPVFQKIKQKSKEGSYREFSFKKERRARENMSVGPKKKGRQSELRFRRICFNSIERFPWLKGCEKATRTEDIKEHIDMFLNAEIDGCAHRIPIQIKSSLFGKSVYMEKYRLVAYVVLVHHSFTDPQIAREIKQAYRWYQKKLEFESAESKATATG